MTRLHLWGIGSARALRVHWTLQELGLAYGVTPIRTRTPEQTAPAFRAVNPLHKIPVLEIDGERFTESGAISLELAARFRKPVDLWPDAARARVLEWCFHVAMELDATSLYVIRRHRDLAAIYGAAPAVVAGARDYWLKQAAKTETALAEGGPWLLGETFTVADIMLGTCLRWARRCEVALPPAIAAYEQRLLARPARQRAEEANEGRLDTASPASVERL